MTPTKAEQLHKLSLDRKKLPSLIFDLAEGSEAERRLGLIKWINEHQPTDIAKKGGMASIVVYTAARTDADLTDGIAKRQIDAYEEWKDIVTETDRVITLDTFNDLAQKYNIKGGKWVLPMVAKETNSAWKVLSWKLSHKLLPEGCVRISVTTDKEDVQEQGGSHEKVQPSGKKESSDADTDDSDMSKEGGVKNSLNESESEKDETDSKAEKKEERKPREKPAHFINIWNRDANDCKLILEIEQAVRKAGITRRMSYKPDVYSAIGIYSGNQFKLRPTIFCSKWNMEKKKCVVESTSNLDWSYKIEKIQASGEAKEI